MGGVASADGAQDAAQPGVGPAAGAGPKRPAGDARERVPVARRVLASAMSTVSRSWSRAAAPRRRPIRSGRPRTCGRRSGCGEAPRWQTWLSSRLPRRRSPGWRNAGGRRSRRGSTRSSPSAGMRIWSPSWRRRWRSSRFASVFTASSCSRCTAAVARRRRSRRTAGRGRRWSRRSASSRTPSCGRCRSRSSPRTRRSTPRRAGRICRPGSTVVHRCWRAVTASSPSSVALVADACDGRGGLAFVSGPRGIGKTRLAQELAREALRRRMVVLYAGAADAPTAVPEDAERATVLIVDDADDAGVEMLERAAALSGSSAHRRLLVLVLHRRARAGDLRRPTGTPARARPARKRRRGRDRFPVPARGVRGTSGRRPRGGEWRRTADRASRREGLGAGARVGVDRRERRPRRQRARRAAVGRDGPVRRSARASSARGARAALQRRGRRAPAGGGLSVPRACHVRRGRTPSTSSGASGWWPSWSPGSWARRCSP